MAGALVSLEPQASMNVGTVLPQTKHVTHGVSVKVTGRPVGSLTESCNSIS